MTREREIQKVTLVGSAGNMGLFAFKLIAGILGHSSAMVADAVHSLSDFITDVIVLVFVSLSAKPQDESHDYGHGKFETIATFFIGLALVAAATGIILAGILSLVEWFQGAQLEAPSMLALWAALLSIVVKEILFHYTAHCGKRLNSQAMIANAWHHRSDALSSIAAAIGIGCAILLGDRWTVMDPVASVIVGFVLMNVAIKLLRTSINELTDSSLNADVEREIEEIITSFPGICEPHNLRTRHIGNRIAIEAHIRMDGDISLFDAHSRATMVEQKLKERFGSDTHVTIHMEPIKESNND
jgi:cation diffusion facilitator family transporter